MAPVLTLGGWYVYVVLQFCCHIARPGLVLRIARGLLFFVVPPRTSLSPSSLSCLLKRLAPSRKLNPPRGGPLGLVGLVGLYKYKGQEKKIGVGIISLGSP